MLKKAKCIPVGQVGQLSVLGDDDMMDDDYTEHRAQDDDDDYSDDDNLQLASSFIGRHRPPIHYDFHLRPTAWRSAPSVEDALADEDDGAHDDPESSFTVALVCILVVVACSLAMTIGVYAVHAKRQNDAARDGTLGSSSQHSEAEPSEPAGSVSVNWDQRALDGVAGVVAELGCDTELVQPQSNVPVTRDVGRYEVSIA